MKTADLHTDIVYRIKHDDCAVVVDLDTTWTVGNTPVRLGSSKCLRVLTAARRGQRYLPVVIWKGPRGHDTDAEAEAEALRRAAQVAALMLRDGRPVEEVNRAVVLAHRGESEPARTPGEFTVTRGRVVFGVIRAQDILATDADAQVDEANRRAFAEARRELLAAKAGRQAAAMTSVMPVLVAAGLSRQVPSSSAVTSVTLSWVQVQELIAAARATGDACDEQSVTDSGGGVDTPAQR